MRLPAIACVIALCASVSMADYGDPWLPNWPGETGYTSQFWGLHAVGGEEPAQPLAPDNYCENDFGTPTAVWETHVPQGYYGWNPAPTGDHPSWVDEVWGGMVQFAGEDEIHLTMTVPTGSDGGSLKIFVQHDWYNRGSMMPSVAGATDVTPAGYYDYEIGMSGSGYEWYRTTRVFEFLDNPGSIDVVLTGTGFSPLVDSFSVTTAVDAAIPAEMPVPEPATIALLAVGALLTLGRRRTTVRRLP